MTEPQSQSVRCPVHGTYYRPDRDKICPRCRDAADRGYMATPQVLAQASSKRMSPVLAVVWLVVLGGVGWGGYQFLMSMGDKGEDLYAETVEVASRIDPAVVRAQIEALEDLVYADEIEEFSQGSRIQRASLTLYQRIMARVPRLLATRHGRRIVEFGTRASASEDVGYGGVDMERVRREWEAVRAEVFHDAAWFRTAGR